MSIRGCHKHKNWLATLKKGDTVLVKGTVKYADHGTFEKGGNLQHGLCLRLADYTLGP